jgi:hypothetical protein
MLIFLLQTIDSMPARRAEQQALLSQEQSALVDDKATHLHPSSGRMISFSDSISIYEVPKVPEDVRHHVWYTAQDYVKLSKSLESSLKKMEEGKLKESPKKDSLVGLQRLTRTGVHLKKQRQQLAREVLFQEQQLQRRIKTRGSNKPKHADPEELARVYAIVCSSCSVEALLTGLRVETTVKREHIEDDEKLAVLQQKNENDSKSSFDKNNSQVPKTRRSFLSHVLGGTRRI